ncbi:hypothetical protein, partial [Lonsdalea populi]|uniref:hypothetical protein n=1 Tax=Lonsdalea populi TaxID=1172565 RepID=UPI001C657482
LRGKPATAGGRTECIAVTSQNLNCCPLWRTGIVQGRSIAIVSAISHAPEKSIQLKLWGKLHE